MLPDVPQTLRLRGDFPQVPLVAHRPGPGGPQLVDQLQQGVFEHLHVSRRLNRPPTDWRIGPITHDRLWTAALHYHAWAWELAESARHHGASAEQADELLRHYLADWIARCDLPVPGSRELAWNSYAVATRIGWWCRLFHALGSHGRRHWGPLQPIFLSSLWTQAEYLHRHLEFDLLANHLLRDAAGLAWAGRFFQGPQPGRWMQTATRLALRQAEEQVLGDGGHFERSPMYHLHVMEDLLSLALLLEDETARTRLRETWRRMAEFLCWTRHPDGQIPLLNDGGFNGACDPQQMLRAGGRSLALSVPTEPKRGGKFFPDFGLLAWHSQPWSVFFDIGPVGPDYQGGHAHADTLSFEASFAGRRLFVDPGSFGYDRDESRRYDRATASHNTVCIDQTDSSEVWDIFRVGRRARPIGVDVDLTADLCSAVAAHTGYDHLAGRPRHHRELLVSEGGPLTIIDNIEGSGTHSIEGGVLIAPGWQAEETSEGWRIHDENRAVRVTLEADQLRRATKQQPYHPEYGRQDRCQRLVWQGMVQLPYKIVFRAEPMRSPTG